MGINSRFLIVDRCAKSKVRVYQHLFASQSYLDASKLHSDHWNKNHVFSKFMKSSLYVLNGQPRRWRLTSLISSGG